MKSFIKKYSKVVLLLMPVLISGLFLLNSGQAFAQSEQEKNNCKTFARYLGPLAEGLPQFCSMSELLTFVLNIMLAMAGAVSVLFIVIGGFFYLTAAGNEEQIEKGKKILINAVIGLVVILMATAIVRIVSGALNTGRATTTIPTTQTLSSRNMHADKTVL